MDELIAALEAAEGPSRELDACIAIALYPGATIEPHCPGDPPLVWLHGCNPRVPDAVYSAVHKRRLPAYTASFDAAVSLVPEGWAIDGFSIWPGIKPFLNLLGTHEHKGGRWHDGRDGKIRVEAATPTLALCIAALRARQVQP